MGTWFPVAQATMRQAATNKSADLLFILRAFLYLITGYFLPAT
jgi:hypothetical protein